MARIRIMCPLVHTIDGAVDVESVGTRVHGYEVVHRDVGVLALLRLGRLAEHQARHGRATESVARQGAAQHSTAGQSGAHGTPHGRRGSRQAARQGIGECDTWHTTRHGTARHSSRQAAYTVLPQHM